VKSLIAIVVVVAGLLALDFAAKSYAQSQLQQEVNKRATADTSVHASIRSFPFLGRLLVQQKVSRVALASAEVKTGSLVFSDVSLSMNDVKVDRNQLLKNQKVLITSIGQTTASADLTAQALSDAVGVPVQIADGKVTAKVVGQEVTAQVEATPNGLAIRVVGLPLPAFTIPGSDLLPCLGGTKVGDGRIHFSCTVEGIPPAVVRLVNGKAA